METKNGVVYDDKKTCIKVIENEKGHKVIQVFVEGEIAMSYYPDDYSIMVDRGTERISYAKWGYSHRSIHANEICDFEEMKSAINAIAHFANR